MSMCDLCLADLAPERTKELSSAQMHDVAANGFGPCVAGTILAKSGRPFAAASGTELTGGGSARRNFGAVSC